MLHPVELYVPPRGISDTPAVLSGEGACHVGVGCLTFNGY